MKAYKTTTPTGQTARIAFSKCGEAMRVTTDWQDRIIPRELIRLLAGEDRWMRDLQVPCNDCGKPHTASDSDGGRYCPACEEECYEENRLADEAVAS